VNVISPDDISEPNTDIKITPILDDINNNDIHDIHEIYDVDYVTVAILVKDKAHTLKYYLHCIYSQTYPKNRIHLYIRTNDNNDESESILQEFISLHEKEYASIFFDSSKINEKLRKFTQHEWSYERFIIMGEIRQKSIQYAIEKNSHYFVSDCDNFTKPETISTLLRLGPEFPVVGGFLVHSDYYSNYHFTVDPKGYFKESDHYYNVHKRIIRGVIEVDVIHCSYLCRREVLSQLSYLDDGSGHHEYVIFSRNCRAQGIKQYLDNRQIYGCLTFKEDSESFEKEEWFLQFPWMISQ